MRDAVGPFEGSVVQPTNSDDSIAIEDVCRRKRYLRVIKFFRSLILHPKVSVAS